MKEWIQFFPLISQVGGGLLSFPTFIKDSKVLSLIVQGENSAPGGGSDYAKDSEEEAFEAQLVCSKSPKKHFELNRPVDLLETDNNQLEGDDGHACRHVVVAVEVVVILQPR